MIAAGESMPTYVYSCPKCGNRFDRFQRITEAPAATCDSCGEAECTRVITGGTFHLKGGGWYKSDYGASGPAAKETPPVTAPCGGDPAKCNGCEAAD